VGPLSGRGRGQRASRTRRPAHARGPIQVVCHRLARAFERGPGFFRLVPAREGRRPRGWRPRARWRSRGGRSPAGLWLFLANRRLQARSASSSRGQARAPPHRRLRGRSAERGQHGGAGRWFNPSNGRKASNQPGRVEDTSEAEAARRVRRWRRRGEVGGVPPLNPFGTPPAGGVRSVGWRRAVGSRTTVAVEKQAAPAGQGRATGWVAPRRNERSFNRGVGLGLCWTCNFPQHGQTRVPTVGASPGVGTVLENPKKIESSREAWPGGPEGNRR